ncbi:MAG TPA: hypothetical protein PLQ19_07120 [Aeromicrobium sp.]|nr:hypothetical protein [Aeromicrobium sp.]
MNPKYRRLLIPGLLLALIVVVVIASLAQKASAEETSPGLVLSDPRITESSGLAISRKHHDLAYTVNDSGGAAEIYAIDLTSGKTVGVTKVAAGFQDVEALALHAGKLWIADVGDNAARRLTTTLYQISEPGRGNRTVSPKQYRIELSGGPADVETLLIDPASGQLQLVSKGIFGGNVFAADPADLRTGQVATFKQIADSVPGLVTDGAYSPNGSQVALLTYLSLVTVDPQTWQVVGSQPLPKLEQPETVDFLTETRLLVGSEGENSPLKEVTLAPSDANVETVATLDSGEAVADSTNTSKTAAPAKEIDTAAAAESKFSIVGIWPLSVALLAFGLVVLVARAVRSKAARRG